MNLTSATVANRHQAYSVFETKTSDAYDVATEPQTQHQGIGPQGLRIGFKARRLSANEGLGCKHRNLVFSPH